MKNFFIISFVCILSTMPLFVGAYVSPGKPTGFVNDFADMLQTQERVSLESLLTNFQKKSQNEITVVTIPSLQNDAIESMATELFKEWGIGQEGKDNGVLLLIARDEKKIRIEVGYGLEGLLTDAQSSWIIRNIITPSFREGNFYGGIQNAVQKIINVIDGTETIPSDASNNAQNTSRQSSFDWFLLFFIIPLWLAGILGRSKSWWAGGVLGGVIGIILGFIKGFLYVGIFWIAFLIPIGLLFDYIVSKNYERARKNGLHAPWWIGGGGFGGHGGGSGGFSGFGGGGSGGGGSSGDW